MSKRPNGRKANDWILYAFIIKKKGGVLSLHDLSSALSKFRRRDSRPRRIASVINQNQSKGFERITFYSDGSYVSSYSYNGDELQINPSTLANWNKIIE